MITIHITGLDGLKDSFGRWPKELKRELSLAVKKSAFLIEREAKPITPFDTGMLMGSIRSDIKPLWASIAPHKKYSIFVHEGTRRWPLSVPPKKPGKVRQFMKVGAEKATPKIEKEFERAVDKALSR